MAIPLYYDYANGNTFARGMAYGYALAINIYA